MAVTLENMRSHGRRNVLVYCGNARRCSHSATINADRWPDNATFTDLAPRFVCTDCGAIGADVRPDWGASTALGGATIVNYCCADFIG